MNGLMGERICHQGKPFNYKDERETDLVCSLLESFCAPSYRGAFACRSLRFEPSDPMPGHSR